MAVSEEEIARNIRDGVSRSLRELIKILSPDRTGMRLDTAREQFERSLAEVVAASITEAVNEGVD